MVEKIDFQNEENKALHSINKALVHDSITENKEYKSEELILQVCNLHSGRYLCEFNKNSNKYIGQVTENLEREGFGYYQYPNGNFYLGEWFANNQFGEGIYLNSKKISNDLVTHKLYRGGFFNGKRHMKGVCSIITEAPGNNDLSNADISTYIGVFDEGILKNGVFLNKTGNLFLVYFGKFNENGKINDDCSLMYDNQNEIVFRGKITNGEIDNGFMMEFNAKDKILDFEFLDQKKKIKGGEKSIDKSTLEEIKSEASNYRKILYGSDWFTSIYIKSKEVITTPILVTTQDFDNQTKLDKLIAFMKNEEEIVLYDHLIKTLYSE